MLIKVDLLNTNKTHILETGSLKGWPSEVVIYTDGASRGNPGPSSLGVSVRDPSGEIIFEYAECLGQQTNNFAEYMAVKKSLEFCKTNNIQSLVLRSDSQLLIRQLIGMYKVKSISLRPIYCDCMELLKHIPHKKLEHVKRELNKRADELANIVLDQNI